MPNELTLTATWGRDPLPAGGDGQLAYLLLDLTADVQVAAPGAAMKRCMCGSPLTVMPQRASTLPGWAIRKVSSRMNMQSASSRMHFT